MMIEYSAISQPSPIPNWKNEDSYFIGVSDSQITMMVADGATQRINLPIFQPVWESLGSGTTGARYASQFMCQFVSTHPDLNATELLIQGNQELGTTLKTVVGELKPENFLAFDERFQNDPRLFRLALPVCAATIVKIYPQENLLEYAHVADTTVLVQRDNGQVERITKDQIGDYDAQALRFAQEIQRQQQLPHLADVIKHPEVIESNRRNGIYHNYVDEQGNT